MNAQSGSTRSWDYLDFDLEIREGDPREYSVSVRSPAGEAQEQMGFPFDERALRDRLWNLEVALLRSSGTRRSLSREEQTVQDFGRSLFEALLVGDVRTRYLMSLDKAEQQDKGLRMKLRVQPPELAVLPWEFLYDPDRDYLCFSPDTPIVRYVDLRQPVRRLSVEPPLRILGMVASPRGLDPLDVEHEKGLMDEAIEELREEGLVELTWLEGQTWRDLRRAMRRGGPWHVFHFVGHGNFDVAREEGAIALTDGETGRAHLLRSRDLARLLDGHRHLRLVFLNSCEGARGSEGDPFSGTAATLVHNRIPAVVAIQYEITDKAAIEFSRSFYEALADGWPVDAAVTDARVAVSMDSMLEWGTPVLYMRSPDGRLFNIASATRRTELPDEILGREEALRQDREGVESIWADRQLNRSDVGWLEEQIEKLELNHSDAAAIEREVMGDTKQAILGHKKRAAEEHAAAKERYRKAIVDAWANHNLSDADAEQLDFLASDLGLSEETSAEIECLVMGDTKQAVFERQEQAAREKEREERLQGLYDRACELYEKQEWQAVIDVFAQIYREEPTYPDDNGLLASAHEALEIAKKRVEALRQYREAVEFAWADEKLDGDEVQRLKNLAHELGLERSAASDIERKVMGDTIEAILGHQEQAAREEEQRSTTLEESTDGAMPKLEVQGVGTFDVEEGKRLVRAIEEDAGVDILHRCGSYARCTTCRIEYLEGEPEKMTRAEREVLVSRDLLGKVRLSCQALCDHDVKVRVLMTVSSTGLDGPGPKPQPEITPDPEWVDKPPS